ncbi:hypothetical protein A0H81_01316 [Grifola frondosa]|uniref:Uncharacterized protein n=1 Tax=Grifola frondosa TaxID=5627 RepID=A0A1C7MQ36_GRIFR|nr:hypothetical protein A0H81_01316 [Grifola frondosa]
MPFARLRASLPYHAYGHPPPLTSVAPLLHRLLPLSRLPFPRHFLSYLRATVPSSPPLTRIRSPTSPSPYVCLALRVQPTYVVFCTYIAHRRSVMHLRLLITEQPMSFFSSHAAPNISPVTTNVLSNPLSFTTDQRQCLVTIFAVLPSFPVFSILFRSF